MKFKLLLLLFAALLFHTLPSCKSSIGGQVDTVEFSPKGVVDTVLQTYNGILSCPFLQWEHEGRTEIGAYMDNPSWAVVVVNIDNDFEPFPVYTQHPADYFIEKTYGCRCFMNGKEATVFVDASSIKPLRLRTNYEGEQMNRINASQKNE